MDDGDYGYDDDDDNEYNDDDDDAQGECFGSPGRPTSALCSGEVATIIIIIIVIVIIIH